MTALTVLAEAIPAYYRTPLPASVTNDPYGYAASIFGLLGACLLALQWIGVLTRRMMRDPHSWRHPVSIHRVMVIAMLASVLLRSGPDVLFFGLWRDLAPVTRFGLARWNRILDGVAMLPMVIWWALSLYSSRLTEAQLGREPIPRDLWPSWRQFAHAASFTALLLLISISIAFS